MTITEDQLVLLRDKYVLWDRASREGSMDLRDYNRRAADALKAALCIVSQPAALRIPSGVEREGWKLVPVEPTEAMLNRAERFSLVTERHQFAEVYSAMLSASPSPREVERE